MAHPSLTDKFRQALARLELRDRARGRKRKREELAEEAGFSESYLANLLSGRQDNPSVAAVEGFAKVLEVPAMFFLPSGPPTLEQALWLNSPQVKQWVGLLQGLSPEQIEILIEVVDTCREQFGVPPTGLQGTKETPPVSGHQRRRGNRREGPNLPEDEALARIIRSLRGG